MFESKDMKELIYFNGFKAAGDHYFILFKRDDQEISVPIDKSHYNILKGHINLLTLNHNKPVDIIE